MYTVFSWVGGELCHIEESKQTHTVLGWTFYPSHLWPFQSAVLHPKGQPSAKYGSIKGLLKVRLTFLSNPMRSNYGLGLLLTCHQLL